MNGSLHWYVPKKGAFCQFLSHQIIYFDPKTDDFEEIPMPQPKQEDGHRILGLGDLHGCL